MNIQRIGEDIIRVSIPKTDLIQRNINVNSLDGKSPDVQELFWYILDKAESEIDFNITNSQFYVEAVPDSDNGFIATITKVKDNDKDDNDKDDNDKDDNDKSIQKHIKNKFNDNPVKTPTLNNKRIFSSIVIYEVKNLDDLTFLCKQLHCIYNGDSSLFKHSNNYYLLLIKENITNSKLFELLLTEYGHKAPNATFLEGYLNEYGTIMIQHNAVKILNDFY